MSSSQMAGPSPESGLFRPFFPFWASSALSFGWSAFCIRSFAHGHECASLLSLACAWSSSFQGFGEGGLGGKLLTVSRNASRLVYGQWQLLG